MRITESSGRRVQVAGKPRQPSVRPDGLGSVVKRN